MRLEVTIDGMLSVHARHAVFAALGGVAGVRQADVELGKAVIELEHGAETISALAELQQRLDEAVAAVGCQVLEIRPLPRELPQL